MPKLRTRLVALTCAGAALLSTAAVTTVTPASNASTAVTSSSATRLGLARLIKSGTPTGRAIATFDAVPTAAQVAALRNAGLTVRPMKSLPLAQVAGPVSAMVQVVRNGTARDVYPDEVLQYLDTASSNVMSSSPSAAASLRAKGFTGKGVTVGVIDSGCDATHPDLADHVVHNVTLYSPEYANQQPTPETTLVVPIGDTPYQNTDLGSGHGTHVAGIIAADSTTAAYGSRLGVAPDAKLVCMSIGAVITTTAVVTGFDHILSTPGHFSIDVINNSWGNSFRQFDPADPVNVATKAATAARMVVVFAAGNSGSGDAEASVSPFNQAPWVISVAASDPKRKRGGFSSNGIRYDNSIATAIGAGGHTVTLGDRRGLTHPDISAPGVDVSSTCASTGTVIGPCPTPDNATASGTSMASPHIAGAAAVLLQAQPRLTPGQVQQALYATATPMTTTTGKPVPSWEVGFGHVNLDKAVTLVRSTDWKTKLAAAFQRARARVLASDGMTMLRNDMWQYAAPPVTFQGSDSKTYSLPVGTGTRFVYITLVYPTPGTAANFALYTAQLISPTGQVLGTSKTDILYAHGTATLQVPVSKAGAYKILVSGDYAASDPDTLDSDSVNGRVVFVSAAQLRRS